MSNGPLRLAVATKEGLGISQHFGHATTFAIYQVTPENCTFLERRDVELYCLGNSSSQSAMAKILQTIHDCHAVFVAKIGDGPTEKLARIGVKAVSDYAYEAIEASLLDYASKLAHDIH